MTYASSLRKSFIRAQVPAQEAQVLGRQAFRAVHRWHVARGGRPRFKAARRGLHSLAAKDRNGALRPVLDGAGQLVGLRRGADLVLPARAPKTRAEKAEHTRISGLIGAGKLLSCRIVRNQIRGRYVFSAQLVFDGPPPVRHPVGEETVSIDLGPSTAHLVSDTETFHAPLAPGVSVPLRTLRRLQRHLDRQHRAGSPECFDEAGQHKTH